MNTIKSEPKIIVSTDTIQAGVRHIADVLQDKLGLPQVVIPIMNGAMMFSADLLRALYPELNPVIMPVKLYKAERQIDKTKFAVLTETSSLQLRATPGGITNKNVVIADVLVGSGATMLAAYKLIKEKHPAHITTVSLALSDGSAFIPDIYAIKIPAYIEGSHLLGYGLGREGRYRNAPFIYLDKQ